MSEQPRRAQSDRPQVPDRSPERDPRTGRQSAAERIRNQGQWVEQQILEAQRRGDFDDLPGKGKPLEGLDREHDPDWWVKRLVERERISVLPPPLALRKADAELDGELDRLTTEAQVRTAVEEFNARVRHALLTNLGGPPVITPRRDVEAEVARWTERREARIAAQRAALAQRRAEQPRRRGLFRRRTS